MNIKKKYLESAKIYCDSRIILEENQLRRVIKNRHDLPIHSDSFCGQNIVISQINQVRKLRTLLTGIYCLEDNIVKIQS